MGRFARNLWCSRSREIHILHSHFESASPSEQHGAEELQKFLEEMSGARLPIVTDARRPDGDLVLVGDSKQLQKLGLQIPFANLGTEGFVLRTEGKHLVIAGGKQRGTLYGVYAFLEKLGCRWFTTEVSVIPKKSTLVVEALAMNRSSRPSNIGSPKSPKPADKDWAVRNRLNGGFQRLDESTGGKISYYPFVHSFYPYFPPRNTFRIIRNTMRSSTASGGERTRSFV